MGKTSLSNYSPEINSENLLVLLTPLGVIFGVVFFLPLLDQMSLPIRQMRIAVIILLSLIVSQPLIASLLPPKTSPVAYPPYYPPEIQRVSAWMKPDELMMSDIPWAVAWYGDRQCAWITINSQEQFFKFNDYVKTVKALYLTLDTLNGKLLTECLQGGADSWGNFALRTIVGRQIPSQFTLRYTAEDLSTGMFLTDRQRWPTR